MELALVLALVVVMGLVLRSVDASRQRRGHAAPSSATWIVVALLVGGLLLPVLAFASGFLMFVARGRD